MQILFIGEFISLTLSVLDLEKANAEYEPSKNPLFGKPDKENMKKLLLYLRDNKIPLIISEDEYKKGGSINERCPIGTKIQTLIFDKNKFNKSACLVWAKAANMRHGKVDEKENTFRIRQSAPGNFKKDSFKTIDLTEGIKAVIACPKK